MSKPIQGPNLGADGAVDIDQLEVDVLIICKNPAGLQQSAAFLTRRGWPTTVLGNLGKAIDYIVKNQPDFVMISCNHPNPGMSRLPSLLKQMKTNCIGFSETGDAGSTAKLTNLPFPHKLQGLPSGPNVQRMIRKILMDIYNPQASESGADTVESQSENDRQIFSGSSKSKDGSSISVKGGVESQDVVGRTGGEDEESLDVGNYRMGRKKERKRLKDLMPQSESALADAMSAELQAEKEALLELANAAEAKSKEAGASDASSPESVNQSASGIDGLNLESEENGIEGSHQPNKSRQAYSPDQGAPSLKAKGVMEQGHGSADAKSAMQDGHGNTDPHSLTQELASKALKNGNNIPSSEKAGTGNTAHASGAAAVMGNELDAKSEFASAKVKPVKSFSPLSTDQKTTAYQELFEKSVEMAMERTCKPDLTTKPLSSVDVVGTLPIDAAELHGYLVVSMAGVAPDGQLEFLHSFRAELCELMMDYGLSAKVDEGFVVAQEPFPFLDWSKQESVMCFTASHQGSEVGVSFLRTEERLNGPRESEKADMALVSVKEIIADQPVPFKAYLHFKRSDRLFLYLRNGRRLYKDQKERLIDHKVSDFYIKAVDIKNYKNYSAANFISQSLQRLKVPRSA